MAAPVTLLVLMMLAAVSGQSDKVVMCYYGSWATYRNYPATFDVSDIDTSLCTHIVYTFAGIDASTGEITSLDPYNDFEQDYGKGSFLKFTALADEGVVPLLSVGGWNEGSTKYSEVAALEATRQRFAESAVAFLQEYGFQGLDLAWEYPSQRGGSADDRDNFVLLCQELYERLHEAGLIFTVAAGSSYDMIETSYDVAGFAQFVDYISLMTFDYHTASSDSVTNFVAPLYARADDDERLNVNYSVTQWLSAGAPAEKLLVGFPFYGRSYTLQDPAQHEVGAPVSGAGTAGTYTQEAGYLAYYEICLQEWTETATDNGDVYSYRDDQWVNYKTNETIQAMGDYVIEMGLAGAMIWPIETDDFRGLCSEQAKPLLTAVNTAFGRI